MNSTATSSRMGKHMKESPMRQGRYVFLAVAGLLTVFAAVAWCAPAGTVWALAIVTLVPAATLGMGGAIFAVSQIRHQDEIVIQRGPER